ncbi:MAG: GHKL domain-containing protein [Blautia sp.]|nr:GHKL domain-containing protein [Blautia sp.]
MIEYNNVSNILTMFVEWLGIILFFRQLPRKNEDEHPFLAMLCLLLLTFIYLPVIGILQTSSEYTIANLISLLLRTLINGLCVFGYLYFTVETVNIARVYFTLFYILIYNVSFNIREIFVPYIRANYHRYSDWLLLLAIIIIQLTLVLIVRKVIPMKDVRSVSAYRWAVIVVAIIIEMCFKWSLIAPLGHNEYRAIDNFLYNFLGTAGVLLLVVLTEVSFFAREKQLQMEKSTMLAEYEAQNAKRAIRSDDDIRRMYHDMKNHMIVLRNMIGDESNAREYVDGLYEYFGGYEAEVVTGNTVVDSLISDKMQRAALKKITFNIVMDLKPLDFIRPLDMVTMFGNALDNAVEAVEILPEDMEKIIYLKTVQYAGMLVIRVSNQFTGERKVTNGVLKTMKADAGNHGIGIRSIKTAAARYGGNVDVEIEKDKHWFRLMIMIPLKITGES